TTERIRSYRTAGSKLLFMDIEDEGVMVQGMVNERTLDSRCDQDEKSAVRKHFRNFMKMIRRGDWISVTGYPHRTSTGELTLLAMSPPNMLSPCLQTLPVGPITDRNILTRNRHVHMLTSPQPSDILRLRSRIERFMCTFFDDNGMTKVTTPLLTAAASGAVARPFETNSNAVEGVPLKLRIAPELWLKRLVLGGLGGVYEIGHVFRNEGIDQTHNPEFTMCEFYLPFATQTDLIALTEKLLADLSAHLQSLRPSTSSSAHPSHTTPLFASLPPPPLFVPPFKRIPFIPTLNALLPRPLPPLHDEPTAHPELLRLCEEVGATLPADTDERARLSVAKLLDALASHVLEPLTLHADSGGQGAAAPGPSDRDAAASAPLPASPTPAVWITDFPAVMSPLAKSYWDGALAQRVAPRAELYVRGRELVNAYEEENSPFAQRDKMRAQGRGRGKGDAESMDVDEDYCDALEWGLPPTGGWGCGLDRLVMVCAGRERVADVLSFGSLRNVVALREGRRGRGKGKGNGKGREKGEKGEGEREE
ncbi:hypothetical protein BDY21DRAFT_290773, partial [Lineolata rhizophorae]